MASFSQANWVMSMTGGDAHAQDEGPHRCLGRSPSGRLAIRAIARPEHGSIDGSETVGATCPIAVGEAMSGTSPVAVRETVCGSCSVAVGETLTGT